MIKKRKFDDLKVGYKGTFKRIVEEDDIKNFSEVSGDQNPLHLDQEYSKSGPFRKPVVHGMWLGSLFSALISKEFSDFLVIYLNQSLNFLMPVKAGDELTVQIEIIKKKKSYNLVLSTEVLNQNNIPVCNGTAEIRLGKSPL